MMELNLDSVNDLKIETSFSKINKVLGTTLTMKKLVISFHLWVFR